MSTRYSLRVTVGFEANGMVTARTHKRLFFFPQVDDPKHLFVRLFLRRQRFWFRQSKLEGRYREIEDLESAIQQLINVGLLMDQNSLHDPEDALLMLTLDELKLLARRTGIKESLTGKQVRRQILGILRLNQNQSYTILNVRLISL